MPAVSAESVDLITATVDLQLPRACATGGASPSRPSPIPTCGSGWSRSSPARTSRPTQLRDFHHLQLTPTAGGQFTLTPRLKVRGGAGAQSELLAPGGAGRWQAVIEAGATLDPTALATWGALAVRLEGLINYDFVDPTDTRQHQLRGTAKLSVPLVPTLFLTVGLDVFAVQRQAARVGRLGRHDASACACTRTLRASLYECGGNLCQTVHRAT